MQTKFLHFVFRKLNIRINRLVYIVKCFEDIVGKSYIWCIYKNDKNDHFTRHDESNFNLHFCGFVSLKLFPCKKVTNFG